MNREVCKKTGDADAATVCSVKDELHREALESLFRVSRAAKRSMNRLCGSAPQGELVLLWQLERLEKKAAGKPVRVSALVRASGQPAPGVSRTLRTLEEKGYTVRRSDPSDHRKTFVALTEAGKSELTDLTEKRKRHMDLVMETLGEARILQLIELSRALEQALDSTGDGAAEKAKNK